MMKFFIVLSLVVASVLSQDVEYGGICNGLLLQCNRHSNTVACTHRETNDTIGVDTCSSGIGVTIGRCQCIRNCNSDGIYHDNGEFDPVQDMCVGYAGQRCSQLVPHCVANASCNYILSVCICSPGYHLDPSDNKHCVPN